MADQRLTDKGNISSIDDADLLHIVDVSDTSGNPTGTSKKGLWSLIKSTLKTYFDTLYVTLSTAQTITGEKTFNADINFTGERYIYFEDGQFLEISDINGDNYIVIDNDIVDVSGKKFSIGSTTSANVVYTDGAAGDPLIIDARENNVIFDLGTNGNRVTPNIGDVLVCTDTSGKVEFQTPSSGAITKEWTFGRKINFHSDGRWVGHYNSEDGAQILNWNRGTGTDPSIPNYYGFILLEPNSVLKKLVLSALYDSVYTAIDIQIWGAEANTTTITKLYSGTFSPVSPDTSLQSYDRYELDMGDISLTNSHRLFVAVRPQQDTLATKTVRGQIKLIWEES